MLPNTKIPAPFNVKTKYSAIKNITHPTLNRLQTLNFKTMDERDYKAMNRELNPPLQQTAVSGSFMCAHVADEKCKEQCYTCSEDEKCDARYSFKATMIHYFQFTEWIAERYNFIGGEWCCWCAKQYDIKDTERYKDTGELWKYWWENCR